MIKRYRLIHLMLSVSVLSVLASCASIPKESVDLSREMGKEIAECRRTQVNLMNAYFRLKEEQIDAWIETNYLPELIRNVQTGLKNEGMVDILTINQNKDIIRSVISQRDKMHEELEKTRLLVLEKIEMQYSQLLQANAGMTALLQSAVDVKKETNDLSQSVKSATGRKIDIDSLDQKFSDYLKNAGTAAGQVTSLYNQIKNDIEAKGE